MVDTVKNVKGNSQLPLELQCPDVPPGRGRVKMNVSHTHVRQLFLL